jgi:hypothetical protein
LEDDMARNDELEQTAEFKAIQGKLFDGAYTFSRALLEAHKLGYHFPLMGKMLDGWIENPPAWLDDPRGDPGIVKEVV